MRVYLESKHTCDLRMSSLICVFMDICGKARAGRETVSVLL